MKSSLYNNLKFLSVVSVFVLLSACAGIAPKTSSIEDRATVRWEKLLSGDLAGSYEYLSPGFRSSVTSLDYQRSILLKRVIWTSADYIDSDCDESTCKVKIDLGFKVAGALPGVKAFNGHQDITETWVMVDGTWYLVP